MGYKLSYGKFNDFLSQLKEGFKIYAPKQFEGIGRFSDQNVIRYSEVYTIEDMIFDKKSHFSPKEILFPITQTLFYFLDGEYEEAEVNEKDIIIFLRPCDINSFKVMDNVFLQNGNIKDIYYEKLRKKVSLFMIECQEGFENCFCVSMGTNTAEEYDAAFRFSDNEVLCNIKNERFESFLIKYSETYDYVPAFITQNKISVTLPDINKIGTDIFDHHMWKEYSDRCIACGRCNFVCPTCTCWTMQDVGYAENGNTGERRRVWAGCHVDGFTDMAGGHGFRKNYGDRMRYKTMHKIYDYKKRNGTHMCIGCGRCDDVCPEYISFPKCINKLNLLIEGEDNHA